MTELMGLLDLDVQYCQQYLCEFFRNAAKIPDVEFIGAWRVGAGRDVTMKESRPSS